MRAYSPTGMMVKGFFGTVYPPFNWNIAAQTFGNPSGAGSGYGSTGGGAWTPSGPPQIPTIPPSLGTFTVGGPVSTGPYPPLGGGGIGYFDGTTNGGFGDGAITPPGAQANGQGISVIAWQPELFHPNTTFLVGLQGTLARNFFSALLLGKPVRYSLATVAATLFDTASVPGFTFWGWANRPPKAAWIGSVVTYNFQF